MKALWRANQQAKCLAASSVAMPKVEDGVAAPGAPGLRHFFGLPRGHTAKIVANGNVFLRECIRPAQCAHGDIVSSPLTDARQGSQPFDRFIGIVMSAIIE